MDRTLSSQLKEYIGKKVKVSGWLYKKRAMGGMTFLVVRDRHGLIQILDEKSKESEKLEGLQNGTILIIEGMAVADDRAPSGVEIHGPEITVDVPVKAVAPIEVDKPIDHNPENFDTLFDNRVIGLRKH